MPSHHVAMFAPLGIVGITGTFEDTQSYRLPVCFCGDACLAVARVQQKNVLSYTEVYSMMVVARSPPSTARIHWDPPVSRAQVASGDSVGGPPLSDLPAPTHVLCQSTLAVGDSCSTANT